MSGGARDIAPELDVTFEGGGEGHVDRVVVAENSWGIDNSSTRGVHIEAVEGDDGPTSER